MDRLKSVSTYIIILFVVGVVATLITSFGTELQNSEHSSLSASSEEYINSMNGGNKQAGLNTTIYDEDVGYVTDLGGNDNKNEFSLDFSFGDKTGSKIQRFVYVTLNIPEFILMDIFRLTTTQWIADLMDWFARIMLFIAIGLWIRRGE